MRGAIKLGDSTGVCDFMGWSNESGGLACGLLSDHVMCSGLFCKDTFKGNLLI